MPLVVTWRNLLLPNSLGGGSKSRSRTVPSTKRLLVPPPTRLDAVHKASVVHGASDRGKRICRAIASGEAIEAKIRQKPDYRADGHHALVALVLGDKLASAGQGRDALQQLHRDIKATVASGVDELLASG